MTFYVAIGRCIHKEKEQSKLSEERKHWLTSSYSGRRVQIFDSHYTLDKPGGVKEQVRAIYGHLSEQLSTQECAFSNSKELQTMYGLYAIA